VEIPTYSPIAGISSEEGELVDRRRQPSPQRALTYLPRGLWGAENLDTPQRDPEP
jgi:hypothetical protein